MSKPVIGVTVGTPTSPAKIADEIKPVRTVNNVAPDENGNVEVEGGLSVTEITSPDDIKKDSPDGFYIQEGGTSTPSGGTTIHYYDSLDAVPADLPDGAFVAVPSEESAGCLPTVEISRYGALDTLSPLTEDETEQVNAVLNGNSKCAVIVALWYGIPICFIAYKISNEEGVSMFGQYVQDATTYYVILTITDGVGYVLLSKG